MSLVSIDNPTPYAAADNYYLSFPKDPITRKFLVYFIWILETLHVGLATRDIYDLFINGFGDLGAVDKFHLIPLTIPILGGISRSILLSGGLFY